LLEKWSARTRASLFDALAALGERDRIEADAPQGIERPDTRSLSRCAR
jgi:hypothetical protein